MSDYELPPGSAFAYDLGERILAAQSALVDAIDTKAAVVMGINGVLAGFLFRTPLQAAPELVIVVAAASLLLSLTAALGSFWVGRFSKAPEFKAVTQRIQATEAWLKWRFLPNVAEAISTNDRKLKRKTGFLAASMTGCLSWCSMWADT
ncbi:hypothetical protein BH23ACT12_BH23ACT12_04820 [soil metagenome]